MKLEVVVSYMFTVERELVAFSRTFVLFYQIIFQKAKILEAMWECVTYVQQHAPCSTLMDEWGSVVSLNVHSIHGRGKSSAVRI